MSYHRFNSIIFQRFGVGLWDNVCDWLAGKARSYVLDWTIGRIIKHTNLNHSCPYSGLVYIKIDDVSINDTSIRTYIPFEPLIPAGKYRININLTDRYKKMYWL